MIDNIISVTVSHTTTSSILYRCIIYIYRIYTVHTSYYIHTAVVVLTGHAHSASELGSPIGDEFDSGEVARVQRRGGAGL